MLDIQFIRDNPDVVAEKAKQKGYEVDVQKLLTLDSERRTRLTQIDELRRRRNELSEQLKAGKPTAEQIEAGKQLKAEVAQLETDLRTIDDEYEPLLRSVPNMPLSDVPVGATEDQNVVAKTVGQPKQFDFKPKHDYQLGATPGEWIDKERAAKVAGSRFAYLKGGIVQLQFAIIQFVITTLGDEKILQKLIEDNNLDLVAKPFTPVLPPAVLRTEPYVASARLNAEEMTYKLEQDDLWLNASAEHTLCTMYWNEIMPEAELPIRYVGYSTSFRREAGTYGKDMEGIFRMHQFDKLEMEVFSTPETGIDEHKLLVAIQEYLVQQLELPYQLIQKCTADIGKPNARGIDLNCWFPGQQQYRETHTADYIGDYQSRDLKIRVKRDAKNPEKSGAVDLVHTNDATAFALGRIMKAILENYQTADGHVLVPAVLQPYMSGKQQI